MNVQHLGCNYGANDANEFSPHLNKVSGSKTSTPKLKNTQHPGEDQKINHKMPTSETPGKNTTLRPCFLEAMVLFTNFLLKVNYQETCFAESWTTETTETTPEKAASIPDPHILN